MDLPNRNQIIQTCLKHNQPIVLQDLKTNKGAFCLVCLQNMTGFVPPDEIKKQQQELFNQQKKVINQDKSQLQKALDAILYYKNNINQSLDKLIKGLVDKIGIIDQFLINQQLLVESNNNPNINIIDNLKKDFEELRQNNLNDRNQSKSQLQDFQQKYCNINQLLILLDDINQEVQVEYDSRKFQYQLIKESSQNVTGRCGAFAFNKEGNILFVGCVNEIIIYQFLNGKIIKEIQRLRGHSDDVYCLYVMKKSNSFISGSDDNSIIVWELESGNKWTAKTQLKEHKGYVVCILMNKNEDMLISGSKDKTVKIWKQIDNKWSCKQTIAINDYSCSLSLNDEENKLISCGGISLIYVIQLQRDGQWSIAQQINVSEYGYRLCFLNGNQFIFQPKTKVFIELYNYDNEQKQFHKLKQIQVQSCGSCDWSFQIQFIKDLKILTVKHGQFLNIFKVNEDGDINLVQTIEFQTEILYGSLSDDGKYIVTWDLKSKEIQIRHLQYLK